MVIFLNWKHDYFLEDFILDVGGNMLKRIKNIGVVGLGYVGLPLACLCAKQGFNVIGYDRCDGTISSLKSGRSHISDKTVERLLSEALSVNNLSVTLSVGDLNDCDIYIICVPTPVTEGNIPDLKPLIGAINDISPYIDAGNIVVVESTVFPGTCEDIVAPLIRKLTGFSCNGDISIAHCPERVNPGDEFWTSENIPRVVGAMDDNGAIRTAEFYSQILNGPVIQVEAVKDLLRPKFSLGSDGQVVTNQAPLGSVTVMKSIRDAEAVKAMENTVRDVNISFVNELAKISDALDLDVVDIIDGMSTKPFGKGPFYPGVGVGGHCIAVDPEWLKAASIKAGYVPEMIQLSRSINSGMPAYTVEVLHSLLDNAGISVQGANIAILGVAYKKNVDDLRESPFFDVRKELENKKCNIGVFDTWITDENTHDSLESILDWAEGIIIVTDHDNMIQDIENENLDAYNIKVIVDGRNTLNSEKIPSNISYRGIGRRKI
jgi:UDP-N-acetyl-D-glucosamine dehydrogenase